MEKWNWALTFLSGGSLAAIVAGISVLINRRNVKSEAAARDLKTPAEVDQLMANTRSVEIDNILKVNEAIAAGYAATQAELGKLRTDVAASRNETNGVKDRLGVLERIVREAHEFITHMLDLFEQHAPGVRVGSLPYGYKRPKKEDTLKE